MDELTKRFLNSVNQNAPIIVKELEKEMQQFKKEFNQQEYTKKVQSIKRLKSSEYPVNV